MSLKIGETPTVDDLLHGMIVHSGNDACIVLAEGISGSERAFADEMTRVAREELGFTTAQFRNATGLFDPDHKMTAAELAELSRRIIVDFPQFYAYYAETSFTWGGITQPNRNPLLGRMAGADGLKTGHLSQSGYGLAASAVRDGVRRIVVFNGMPSEQARAREAERLMRLAFDEFEVLSLYAQTPVAGRAPVVLGAAADVAVGPAEPVRLGVVRGRGGNLTARAELSGPIRAPVSAGQVLGELVVLDGAVEVTRVAMVAHEDVPKLGFLGKVWRGFSRTVLGHGEASEPEAPPVAAPAE
jgi:D-alanyl-D-alanine carboxypeptidase (penicillin-binding protein 5/6)